MKSIIACSLLFAALAANAQESKKLKRINVNEFYLFTGSSNVWSNNGTLEDFKALAPQSTLLNSDFSKFNTGSGQHYSNIAMFSTMIGIQFRDKEKKQYRSNPQLRAGISYFNNASMSRWMSTDERIPIDTLVSAKTNQTAYIDSVHSEKYGMRYSSQQLSLDLSLIFRTNPEARWSLYAGIGIIAGISINSNTDIYYSNSYSIDSYFETGNAPFGYRNSHSEYNHSRSEYISESFQNKNNTIFGAYLPLGVDFRIGNKKDFWKRIHLFYEARPSINMTTIPELRTYTNASIFHGLGVKVKWE